MITDPMTLGRLERVDLRDVWESESSHFTPWLAKDENLELLGETIEIDLELEAQETNVGPFRTDILCKDPSGDWVLIENQLERTDHTHLGQLLTYAAGLKAVTIVWIAERFTEERREAIDWLNEITSDHFNFFGLEIELWRIAGSPIAPKFNITCKPNDWSRTVIDATGGEITETKLLQQQYWSGLQNLLIERKSTVKPQKPPPQHWTSFAIGRANFNMTATVNTQKNRIGVAIGCYGPIAKTHYQMLLQDKDVIETEFGDALMWEELPGKKESRIAIRKDVVDLANRDDWPAQHLWLAEKLERLHKVFGPRVKELNAEDYAEPEQE